MFALLINLLIFDHLWRNGYLLLVFFLSSRVKLSYAEDYYHLLHDIFENLPWEFAVAICRRILPWEFAAGICRGFFVFVSKTFFVYVSKSCLYGSKPFLHVSKTFLFVRFSLLTVFLFVIAVAVMGHRTWLW